MHRADSLDTQTPGKVKVIVKGGINEERDNQLKCKNKVFKNRVREENQRTEP